MHKVITVYPSGLQALLWAHAAQRFAPLPLSMPAYLAHCADFTTRYLREAERRTEPDLVARRLEEADRIGALLRAARAALPYLPDRVAAAYGGYIPIGSDLSRAIEALESRVHETEEYGE
jgi:hypothetical protein